MADLMLRVRVVSPEQIVFEGDAASIVAPAWDGRMGVLPRHAPLIAALGAGELAIDLPGGGSQRFHIAGGLIRVQNDDVIVLTDHVGEGVATVPA
ncbi:MAG: ATP synthase F1 subunit epsilon [Gemmatimonadota bacterium]